ncbi:MAG: 16S rRNA (guanine(966)-N(2))-methyltransferase RsmD [Alphaproteobacteria bacterium]|nr:16S rRNA (guanine(966)-N(2))-methyltransferase RsmD [Alphaproteobacteria bacterium]
MRIVSGKYGGRRLLAPKNQDIRPTSDKVRGALFNMLQSRGLIAEAVVLDVFSGTGALGLEALSRGAASCLFIDKNREPLDLARQNVQALGATGVDFLLKDATKLPLRPDGRFPATLVFLDPPYGKGLAPPARDLLHRGSWLAQDAYIVAETEKAFTADAFLPPFTVLDERIYGDTKVFLLAYAP